MLALCSLALGAWFRLGSQPAPAAEPALAEQAASNLLLYLPIVVEAVQPVWLGPDGGLIAAVAASPQDANRVYAGSWGGGVYRSDDGGLTWRWASRGLGNLTVVSMAADPSNPDIAYAGTYRGGVYKTIDGGSTWSEANQGIQGNAIVYSMVVNPQVSQRVYAATRGLSNNGGQPWAGVTYRSDDGGASWYSVLSNLGGSNYQDWTYMLAISRTSPSTLMAATHEHGIYKTTNAGSGWGAANNGITRFTTRGIGIGPTSASAGTAYTGVWTGEGAFKTTNLGGSWTQKSSGISGANIYGLDIDYANPQKVYLATYNKGVMSTSSGGNSWSNAALSNRPVSTVRVHPGNSALVFAGTAGLGLYASRDSGSSWSPSMDGLQASSATGVVVSPLNPSELYAGVDGGGVQVSSDGGLTWSDFSNNIGSEWVNGLVQQPGNQRAVRLHRRRRPVPLRPAEPGPVLGSGRRQPADRQPARCHSIAARPAPLLALHHLPGSVPAGLALDRSGAGQLRAAGDGLCPLQPQHRLHRQLFGRRIFQQRWRFQLAVRRAFLADGLGAGRRSARSADGLRRHQPVRRRESL